LPLIPGIEGQVIMKAEENPTALSRLLNSPLFGFITHVTAQDHHL
jgi:hypothetical protein